jgi:accessory gene regulator protein AgrB
VKIVLSALILAVAWTAVLAFIARSYGLHSTPGIWAGVFGLPGVVIANWVQSSILHEFNTTLGYSIMFLVNWIFYCSVIRGLVSVKRSLWN